MDERRVEGERSVDALGAAILAFAVAALMVAVNGPAGETRQSAVAALLCVIALALLVWWERRARVPIIAFGIWTNRAVAATNVVTLFCCMAIVGLTAFLPIYVQIVMARSPLVAGFTLTSMLFGWPVAAMVAARGFVLKSIIVAGSALVVIGSFVFVILSPSSSPALVGLGSLVIGSGMGLVGTAGLVLVQEAVGRNQRGAATALSIFSRNLGNTLGAALLGAVLNFNLPTGLLGDRAGSTGSGVLTTHVLTSRQDLAYGL